MILKKNYRENVETEVTFVSWKVAYIQTKIDLVSNCNFQKAKFFSLPFENNLYLGENSKQFCTLYFLLEHYGGNIYFHFRLQDFASSCNICVSFRLVSGAANPHSTTYLIDFFWFVLNWQKKFYFLVNFNCVFNIKH